ncbi:helix-turn-helix domain-containing protein [Streptococcus danieliae]|uniref:helix-turn-helix domain-containing protein n=1 Tax=Streptococcus danieliae TaxID=747656 RepID=UPI0021C7AFEC|nr:helix-turn-helix transcriptional regulator [Streptococcus danieliae]MCU0082618.1 helix-turn-helix domain-containing protein [Streptococcus danieliae]
MNTYELIKELVSDRHMSIAELERKLDLSNGSISKWAKSKPNSEPLEKVAEYLDTSVDYLLGRESYETMKLNQARKDFSDDFIEKEEQQALVMFRKETEGMSEEERERFNKALAGMMQTARNLIKDDSIWK